MPDHGRSRFGVLSSLFVTPNPEPNLNTN